MSSSHYYKSHHLDNLSTKHSRIISHISSASDRPSQYSNQSSYNLQQPLSLSLSLSLSPFYVHMPCQPMTDTGFHACVAGTFCQNFFTLHIGRRCGSAGQSVILSACITALLADNWSKNLHRMYFLTQPYLCSPCRARGFHGTRWPYCKARHHRAHFLLYINKSLNVNIDKSLKI